MQILFFGAGYEYSYLLTYLPCPVLEHSIRFSTEYSISKKLDSRTPFLQIFPTAAFPFLHRDSLDGFPRLFTVNSEHIRLYFLVFCFTLCSFSCCFRAVD